MSNLNVTTSKFFDNFFKWSNKRLIQWIIELRLQFKSYFIIPRKGFSRTCECIVSLTLSLVSHTRNVTLFESLLSSSGPPTFVRIGDLVWNQSDDDAQPQEIAVDSVISHPDYSTRLQYNDISLLKLVRQMDFGFYARPACVNTQYQYSQHMAIATGWGLTEYFGSDSDVLQKVTLDFFTFDECTGRFPSNRKLPQGLFQDQQLCAGSKDESKDTCEGDSGGPLQVYHEVHCMYKVVGITSFGKGCGNAGTPGVYTRVSKYVDWIEQNAFTDG